ncbi:MAG: HlyD family efflux transporter periplasmic adaptor subunit [Fimbriimonas sp.]|nr:HlyD family efflux transporter periplasmic adaptor subunit [Fimbriimonas sp.]
MKTKLAIFVGIIVLILGGWAFESRGSEKTAEIEFRYAPAERGELIRSISATGQVVATTAVDVKSKAGGIVVKLAVEEGTIVKKGDLIARIDPADTQAVYDQANADLASGNAKTSQAEETYRLQVAQNKTEIADAKATLETMKVRLERARIQYTRQPTLSQTNVDSAQANYNAELANLDRLQKVTIPQERRDAVGAVNQARAQKAEALADLVRQKSLLEKGYVAGSAVEKAEAAAEAAKAAFDTAQQKVSTLDTDVASQIQTERLNVSRMAAVLQQAKANVTENDVSRTDLQEAQKAVRSAEIALRKAEDDGMQIGIRRSDILQAQESTVRNRVALANAKVQLDSTTVLAPRDGVVTLKYLEEGTIIPPGTSTFAQGTSLVQISDVTQLFVDCTVDETDVSNVKVGQSVRVVADAFRGTTVDAVVTRVSPAAVTANNVTTVKVRVKILPGAKVQLLPGMNATCEFITMKKENILIVPNQALQDDGTIRIKSADPQKPETRKVVVGEMGNDVVEITSGLKEGEQVVIAEINLDELRAAQKKMVDASQGGGLVGGGPDRSKKVHAKTTK